MNRLSFALLLFGLIGGARICGAAAQQQAAPGQETVIKTQATEVVVPVTVTDDKGRFVSNLEASDFRIFDEDRPQRIAPVIDR